MTTVDEARELAYGAFATGWAARTPFVFENEQANEATLGKGDQPWCRVSFRNMDAHQHSLGGVGNRIWQRDAKMYVQVMAPVNKGMQAGATLAHAARSLFEGVRIGELVGYDGLVREARPDGKWYVTTAEIRLQYYETK